MNFSELLAFTPGSFQNPYIVPYLKALISGQKFWRGQSCGSSLSLWNPNLKIIILLHKMASDWFHMILAVPTIKIQFLNHSDFKCPTRLEIQTTEKLNSFQYFCYSKFLDLFHNCWQIFEKYTPKWQKKMSLVATASIFSSTEL